MSLGRLRMTPLWAYCRRAAKNITTRSLVVLEFALERVTPCAGEDDSQADAPPPPPRFRKTYSLDAEPFEVSSGAVIVAGSMFIGLRGSVLTLWQADALHAAIFNQLPTVP